MAEGLLELIDSVTAVAQTPQRVCSCVQRVERGVYVGGPTAIRPGRFYNVKLGCGLRLPGVRRRGAARPAVHRQGDDVRGVRGGAGMTAKQRFVLEKLADGLQLWQLSGFRRSSNKWGLERPIVRDLQEEEKYPIPGATASSLWRRGWIEGAGTRSSLRQVVFYRITKAGTEALV